MTHRRKNRRLPIERKIDMEMEAAGNPSLDELVLMNVMVYEALKQVVQHCQANDVVPDWLLEALNQRTITAIMDFMDQHNLEWSNEDLEWLPRIEFDSRL